MLDGLDIVIGPVRHLLPLPGSSRRTASGGTSAAVGWRQGSRQCRARPFKRNCADFRGIPHPGVLGCQNRGDSSL